MQVASLGDVVFEVSSDKILTFSELNLERKARFEEHKVLGALPSLEFLAPELLSISLNIKLNARYGLEPIKEAERLAKYCSEGKVLSFIVAGVNLGKVVIETCNQRWRNLMPDSQNPVQNIDLALSLREYKEWN